MTMPREANIRDNAVRLRVVPVPPALVNNNDLVSVGQAFIESRGNRQVRCC
jgi:hypothetical protein